MGSEAPTAAAAGAHLTAALCKRSNRVARVLAYALLEWILIALLLANGVFSYLIARFAAFFGLAPPCALCSRLGVDSLFEPGRRGGAEPLRRVLCDAHAAEVSCLGYCRAHRRLADAGEMCEDCAAAAAPGKALLSWMGRSELGERDLACACCGIALESGFYSPPFLLPKPELPHGLDCGLKEGCATSVVFVSDEGPVIELFDEKPLVEDDSVGVVAQNADITANVERLVPLESIDSLAVRMPAVSSQSPRERNEMMDHGDVRREGVVQDNTFDGNEEKSVMNYDDNKVDGAVDRQIAATVLAPPCMEGTSDDEINASETMEDFAAQQGKTSTLGLFRMRDSQNLGTENTQMIQVVHIFLIHYTFLFIVHAKHFYLFC